MSCRNHETTWLEPSLVLRKATKRMMKDTSRTKICAKEEAMRETRGRRNKKRTHKTDIEKTDREIDQKVYELYGLTKEEINIVEEATA